MLVKDGGLANKYVSVSGTGAIGDPYVVEHSLSVLPDTVSGDLAAQTATLEDILAKIIVAPSTEAKQDAIIAALGLIASEATTGDIKTSVEALAALISAGALSVSLGELPDTVSGDLASISADIGTVQTDLATVKADIALMKADIEDVETLLQTTGITLLPLDSSLDSIDVDKMSKGAITTAHSAITETSTSAEIDCRGYNSLLVHFVSDSSILTWTISVQGAMSSGLTFVPLLDKATGLAVSEITTDISGYFVISNIPDYVKIVATEVDDGATVTVTVQPFNS